MYDFSDITVHENVFDSETLKRIYKLRWESSWSLQTSSLEDTNIFWMMRLDDNKFITENCFNQVKQIIGDNYSLNAVYLNAQSSLQNGTPHYDSLQTNDYTFLVYVNLTWDLTWGGHTIFFSKYWDEESKSSKTFPLYENRLHSLSFMPIPNCGLFFPSNILHFAEGPSKAMNQLRITLAFKLQKNI